MKSNFKNFRKKIMLMLVAATIWAGTAPTTMSAHKLAAQATTVIPGCYGKVLTQALRFGNWMAT